MTITTAQIAAVLIAALRTEKRLPGRRAGPAQLKAQDVLPYVPDYADMAGWFPAPEKLKGELGDQLVRGDLGRYQQQRDAFWAGRGRASPEDVSRWEEAIQWVMQIDRETQRKALWAWAWSRANGRPFSKWYRAQGICKETADRRRRAGLEKIRAHLVRKAAQNAHTGQIGALQIGPQISDVDVILDHVAPRSPSTIKGIKAWRDGAFSRIPRPELADFSWSRKQNELRRLKAKRKAKKAKKEAKDGSASRGVHPVLHPGTAIPAVA